MANVLRVTTPTTGYDNSTGPKINQGNQNQNTNVQGEIRPDKVVRPDARSDAAPQQQEAQLKFRYETNFDSFIQQMAKNSSITEEFSSVFLEKLGLLAQSGLKADFAGQIAEFLSMISMSPQEMAAFLKMQGQSSVRYNGAFFDVLRQIMQQSGSVELRAGILDFLKRYTDMAEGSHMLDSMRRLMQDLKGGMLRNPAEQLEEMNKQMNYNAANGNVKENANLLKSRILPFLNNYITQMHERGSVRENTAMLASLTARYENGDTGRLQEAFLKLMDFQVFSKHFKNLDAATLLKVLNNTEFEKASKKNDAMNQMAEIIRRGVLGEAGVENKMVFKELMQSFLLNESVYMPVLHLTLPVDINGTLMFSELWIDPDEEGQTADGSSERLIKGLIKFDIKDVGFFDLFFLYGTDSGQLSLQLNYPEKLDATENEVRDAIGRIIAKNGMDEGEVVLGTEDGSIPISAAFPNIFERKNSINVTV